MKLRDNNAQCLIVEYPMVQQSAVYGLMELFDTAERLAPGKTPSLTVSRAQLGDRTTRHKSDYAVVILPPCLSESPPEFAEADSAIDWLRLCHGKGALICSVCSGSFLLAKTGLLDGRSATTHWLYESAFRERFPAVQLQFERLIDSHDDVITAGGVMAWTDLGLDLIERYYGMDIMREVSQLFLLEPGVRQQKHYASFVPKRDHEDHEILKVQEMIADSPGTLWSISRLAHETELGERTFLRRFKRATGLNPTHYVQQMRIAQARRILETSAVSIDQIAYRVGYTDSSAFSRLFKRSVGLTPGLYRRRARAQPSESMHTS